MDFGPTVARAGTRRSRPATRLPQFRSAKVQLRRMQGPADNSDDAQAKLGISRALVPTITKAATRRVDNVCFTRRAEVNAS
jgi:hypothetical protein